jgi:hypothetical protein
MPGSLKRSPRKAQETYVKDHDAAVEEYGEGELTHRTEFDAVKHSFEKVGGREPKVEKRLNDGDANASERRLMDVAARSR